MYHLYFSDWVTDGLLKQIEKSEIIMKKMNDPRFMQAMQEFQSNPSAALTKYAGDKDMELFLKEFCSIIGTKLLINYIASVEVDRRNASVCSNAIFWNKVFWWSLPSSDYKACFYEVNGNKCEKYKKS